MSKIELGLFLVTSGCSTANAALPTLTIEPAPAGEVAGPELIVKGSTTDSKAQVDVLVHPLRTNLWWVQRRPAPANRDGSWQTLCYLGTATVGMHESYEVVAVSTRAVLKEGMTLSAIPADGLRSDIITVKRGD